MADIETPNRATLALVAEKVDGLKELTRAEFGNIKDELRTLSDVPVKVAELAKRAESNERRISALERARDRSSEWRRGPLLVVTLGATGVIANLIIALHPHI